MCPAEFVRASIDNGPRFNDMRTDQIDLPESTREYFEWRNGGNPATLGL